MSNLIALILAILFPFSLFFTFHEEAPTQEYLELPPDVTAAATTPQEEDAALSVTPDNLGTPIIDTEDYSFTVTDIYTDLEPAYPLAISTAVQNKSDSTQYTFSLEYICVNRLPVFFKFGEEYNGTVSPGSEVTDSVTFAYSMVPNAFCDYSEKATCATFMLVVEDPDGNETRHTVQLYPQGEEAAVPYTRPAEASDRLIHDSDGVRITYVGTDIGEYRELHFYVENSTDRPVHVSIKKVVINGTECSGTGSLFAYGHSVNYGYADFSQEDFRNAGVAAAGDVKTVELTMDLVFDNFDSPFGSRIDDIIAVIEI